MGLRSDDQVFLGFLTRLVKQAKRNVILIMGNHPVHRAKLVHAWREEYKEKVDIINPRATARSGIPMKCSIRI